MGEICFVFLDPVSTLQHFRLAKGFSGNLVHDNNELQ